MGYLFLFAAFTNYYILPYNHSLIASVSGSVAEYRISRKFFHKNFPVPPAKWAMIEVDVSYFKRYALDEHYLMMGFYTTHDPVDIKKQCIHTRFGQLRNKLLFPTMGTNNGLARPLRCDNNGGFQGSTFHCKVEIPIQDYIPRNFSFSFGFPCDWINSFAYRWLPCFSDLHYNITIHVTNETTCYKLPVGHVCHSYMQFGAYPNLVEEGRIFTYFEPDPSCLGFMELKFFCYLFITKCDPESNQMIPPCKEMCYDYLDACILPTRHVKYINCEYLPSMNENVPCFYETTGCNASPPSVEKATVTMHLKRDNYLLYAVAEYNCHEGFKMKGCKKVRCRFDELWSKPPECLPKSLLTTNRIETKTEPSATAEAESTVVSLTTSINKAMIKLNADSSGTIKLTVHFLVVALLLILLVLLLVMVAVRYKIQLKRARKLGLKRRKGMIDIEMKEIEVPLVQERRKDPQAASPMPRKRPFDATIFYHFDTDDDFFINQLLPELEEKRDFKLCIHSRNFVPGRDIKDNIEEAIESSNSAVFVMSQGFVDSMWCKEEFTHCYIENMKDAAFNLFVIMMQPADTLVNMSNYMKTFFSK